MTASGALPMRWAPERADLGQVQEEKQTQKREPRVEKEGRNISETVACFYGFYGSSLFTGTSQG